MNKSIKFYKKSVQLYESGYIDKAMDICNKSIELNRRNKSSINFLGLLYYFKGDLNSAQKMWNMNYKYNKDMVSKKYMDDSKRDENRFKLYVEAVRLYNNIKINEALDLLNKCVDSDFNCINVNNYMSSCYIKKGQYEKALKCIEKVFSMDKNNIVAKENKKLLIEYGLATRKINYKKIALAISPIMLVLIVIFGVKHMAIKDKKINNNLFSKNNVTMSKEKSLKNTIQKDSKNSNKEKLDKEKNKEQVKEMESKIKVDKTNENKEEMKTKEKTKETEKNKENEKVEQNKNNINNQVFKVELVKTYTDSNEFDKLYDYIKLYDRESLTVNEKIAYDKGVEILKGKGVQYFYDTSLKNLKKEDIKEAESNLIKAYNLSQGSFLRRHIVYFLGVTFEKEEDIQNALKYYGEYYRDNPKGTYNEVVLYKLAILNTYNDKELAGKYARELKDKYPKSIYNNSNIKSILSKK